MTWQTYCVIVGALLLLAGSIGAWQQTALATLYLAANIIIFIFLRS